MPVPSTPSPSEQSSEKSGGALYLFGAVVLVGGAFGLYSWKKQDPPPPQPQATTATATAAPTFQAPVFAPPPPPKEEELPDAGSDAGAKVAAKVGTSTGTGSLGPCGGACTGEATSALRSALTGAAGSARGCYNRALRTSEVSGSMTVSVQVGPGGQVCSAAITNDSVHSNEISQCVLGRFRASAFPPPSGGCVTANIPISFTIKN